MIDGVVLLSDDGAASERGVALSFFDPGGDGDGEESKMRAVCDGRWKQAYVDDGSASARSGQRVVLVMKQPAAGERKEAREGDGDEED
ncbi:hypothetical protein Dimus_030740, partial [Dionaea muscipula]